MVFLNLSYIDETLDGSLPEEAFLYNTTSTISRFDQF